MQLSVQCSCTIHCLDVNMRLVLLVLIAVVCAQIGPCNAHGRLIEPPSRASAWRYGFQTPPDYNDHELYCGGFTRQWKRNEGKCGECGDAYDMREPRPHEHGGFWGTGVIVRRYSPGSQITIRIELTASHMGYFEFRICPEASAKQYCFDKHLLHVLNGTPSVPAPTDLETRFYPRNGSTIYDIKAQLPELECNHCVLQWRYIAGNNWGTCPNGNGAVGCGPQEEFRACSDVALSDELPVSIRPVRPTSRTTSRPKIATSSEATLQHDSEGFDYISFLVAILLILLFVGICFVLFYLHQNRNRKWHALISAINRRFCQIHNTNTKLPATISADMPKVPGIQSPAINSTQKTRNIIDSILGEALPVPPPRSKRPSRVRELSPDEFSVA